METSSFNIEVGLAPIADVKEGESSGRSVYGISLVLIGIFVAVVGYDLWN